MRSRLKTLMLAGVAGLGMAAMAAKPVDAAVIQLGFIVDSSTSIGAADFATIRSGLAGAIQTLIPVGGPDTYEISVVRFATSAATIVNHVLVDSPAALQSVVDAVAAMPYVNGATNYAAAFAAMQAALTGSTAGAALSYVNFATDGNPTEPGTNSQAEAAAATARQNLINAGVDNISIEGIGRLLDANYLQTQICYPGPCDTTAPYDFPRFGFYIAIDSVAEYEAAIQLKIRTVTGQVPEPMSVALFGSGLLGLAAVARRRTSAAR